MSSFNVADYLATDDLTILLGLIGATLFLLNNLYKPQPLVHPILLGRQSDVARVRNAGESAVYRNYSTGLMGRFPVRPSKEAHILADLVRPEGEASRTLWSTKITNNQLQDRSAAFGTGLLRLAGLKPNQSDVLLLLNGGIEFLISDLALASHSILSYTLDSSDLLSSWLDARRPSAIITHADLLPQILELIYDSGVKAGYTIIVVGEPSQQTLASVASQIKLLKFSEVEREGVRVEKILSTLPKESDVFTVHFARHPNEAILGTQLTHENLTAGVAATRLLLPQQQVATPLDTIVSAHSVSTPYGRSVLYTAVFEGTSFATLDSAKIFVADGVSVGQEDVADVLSSKRSPIPSPTILFLKSGHFVALAQEIKKASEEIPVLSSVAWRHKIAGVREGFLTKESLWDRLVFDGARAKILGDIAGTMRVGIISNGGTVPVEAMADARVVLSVPLINTYVHPISAAPILASHPYDFQYFPPEGVKESSHVAHQGPPSVNVEVKLTGVADDSVEQGQNPEGVLSVRGPPVGKLLGIEDYVSIPTPQENDGWLSTGARGEVRSNGSFVITHL